MSTLIYKKDYFGFVYIWRDRKRNMYYIGSHMGSINDGYVCSSKRFRDVYKYRPKTCKRRIIFYLKTNDRQVLLNEEKRWLNMIKDEELTTKYYNACRNCCGEDIEKIRQKTKKQWNDPDYRKKMSESLKKSWTPERKADYKEKMAKHMATQEYKDNMADIVSKRWEDPEYKEKTRATMVEAAQKVDAKQKSDRIKSSWENRDTKNMKRAWPPERKERHAQKMREAWARDDERRRKQAEIAQGVNIKRWA